MLPGYFNQARNARFITFLFVGGVFLLAVRMGLLVPMYSGLLAYAMVLKTSGTIVDEKIRSARSKWVATALVATLVVIVLVVAGAIIHLLLKASTDVHDLLLKMSEILTSARNWLPERMSQAIPQQSELLNKISEWLRTHATEIGTFGLGALKGVGYVLFGVLLGAMVAVSDATRSAPLGPVSRRMLQQVEGLRESFWRVASAQLRISALNTTLTSIYLLVLLPLFGVEIPLSKTLIAVTFLAGLLPVIGNLISNSAITVISLSVSFEVAIAALVFLIVIHKLEYFVNARIVGTSINARAWEILLWMLVMERLFGLVGVAAAPVFYAWFKEEWHLWDRPGSSPVNLEQG
ncbi:putative PurR-regulated permease PerM [Fluviicoccus keumensis]|uniref:Putative PurR-regulated permease PerM n=1 Tax=Fluviicoccus keumensis TaxID=1435465 RepID=A0A4Q7YJX6_9GAMM|nr:AI-2E family transporter [Fluviicoccus keumensis]RZU37103.1 putative PurR-regulated permease PerM [Fluviicoccus keumensis]